MLQRSKKILISVIILSPLLVFVLYKKQVSKTLHTTQMVEEGQEKQNLHHVSPSLKEDFNSEIYNNIISLEENERDLMKNTKNNSLRYVLYWNEAYGNKGIILTLILQ